MTTYNDNDKDLEDGTNVSGTSSRRRGTGSGMENSVLRFKDVNFVVGSGNKQKNILQDVNGKVKWGRTYTIVTFVFGSGCHIVYYHSDLRCPLYSCGSESPLTPLHSLVSFDHRCAGHHGTFRSWKDHAH